MTDNDLPLEEFDAAEKDFSLPDKPLLFRIGADRFRALPMVPPVLLDSLTAALTGLGEEGLPMEEKLNKLATVFDLLLTEDTAPRFRERLLSAKEPVDLNRQVVPIIHWLMEQWGLRPSEPSSAS